MKVHKQRVIRKAIRMGLIYSTLFLLAATTVVQAQDGNHLKDDIESLASKKMMGRLAGTKYEVRAAEYIAERFEEIGLEKVGENQTYFQEFEIPVVEMHGEVKEGDTKRPSRNVVGLLNNNGRNTIIIGAHYDHLGMGYANSRHTGEEAIHFGADDNASGVAMILYLAEKLKAKNLNNNVLFIAFSAEEQGLSGSKYYVNHPLVNFSVVTGMFNFDMVGRLSDDGEMLLTGTGTSPKWNALLDKITLENGKIVRDPSGLGRSDHTNFYLKEIPVLNFFTGIHEDYHKPSDVPSKMDYPGMENIANLALNIINEVDAVLKLSFTQTEDENKRATWGEPAMARKKYKVTLGVIPDYSFSGEGMRIESVIPGRPAEAAGLMDGDIVLKLGDIEVKEMQTYMEALSNFESGMKTIVEYQRNGVVSTAELEF